MRRAELPVVSRVELFPQIKDAVLGKQYDLSVALISPAAMRRAMKYKKLSAKKTPRIASNVLAFSLSKNSGEILLCPATARTQCRSYGMNERVFIMYLFIHGLLHLQGCKHGATMEREERRVMKTFGLRAHE